MATKIKILDGPGIFDFLLSVQMTFGHDGDNHDVSLVIDQCGEMSEEKILVKAMSVVGLDDNLVVFIGTFDRLYFETDGELKTPCFRATYSLKNRKGELSPLTTEEIRFLSETLHINLY